MSGKGVIHKIKIFLKCKKEQKKKICVKKAKEKK